MVGRGGSVNSVRVSAYHGSKKVVERVDNAGLDRSASAANLSAYKRVRDVVSHTNYVHYVFHK